MPETEPLAAEAVEAVEVDLAAEADADQAAEADPLPAPPNGIRTFTPRWRNSPLTDERMARLMPARALPEGPLVPEVAFGRTGPVVVEIGSGHAAHPEADLIAVEVHVPGVARMLALAEDAGVENLWVHPGDAVPFLTERVSPGSLAAVHLFFPDPWPKNKHAKRRFVQQHTLALIASRLEVGGQLLIATDIDSYAAHSRAQLAEHGRWDVVEGVRPPWRPDAGFEAKGVRAGRVVSELRATLRPL